MEFEETRNELERIKEDVELKLIKLAEIEKQSKEQETNLKYVSTVISKKLGSILEQDKFMTFFKKPYVTIPNGKSSVLVVVPKFVKGFQVGWLQKDEGNYYIYELNQYSSWLGDVPKELLEEINFKKEIEGTVEGETVYFAPLMKEAIKQKLKYHLKEIGDNEARILKGHVFDVIAEMIENGCLPFKPRPVSADDLRAAQSKIKLRPYQQEAYDKFLKTGAVGVYHPTGSGKSILALMALDTVKGKKLIVVPTKTLLEQWNWYIQSYTPHIKDEVKIATYQGFRDVGEEFILTIYDECQRLPADTFSRLAVIKTKYRIGLSASPHREDGRENYIFALTGFPIGLNWREYMETVGKSYHPIFVHQVRYSSQKMNKLDELLDSSKKTFIFCDTIDLGKQISRTYGIPFVYGQTTGRLQEIEDNKVLVVSRVMDLGVSVKNLERIIEIDFLFGSRQQEIQRTGRLMHSDMPNVKHDIIMTEEEILKYGKRLWSLQEKGFTIRMVS